MKKSKIILSLMLGGVLLFGGINANAFTTNQGTEIVDRSEFNKLDLTKYGYKSCGDNVFYRYDKNYKTLIISGNGKITDVESLLKYNDDMELLLIKGNIEFIDSFSKMFDDYDVKETSQVESSSSKGRIRPKFDITILESLSTRERIDKFLESKKSYSVSYGSIKDNNKNHLIYSNLEEVVDYRGLLGIYIAIDDDIVGLAGCKAYIEPCVREILNKSTTTPNGDKLTTTTPKATSTVNDEKKVENKEIDKPIESYKNEDTKNTNVETVQATSTIATSTTSTSTVTTSTETTQNNTQQPTGDAKGILTLFVLGVGNLYAMIRFRNKSSKIK